MYAFFYSVYLIFQRYKLWSFTLLALLLLGLAYTASHIKLEEDITRIIPKNDKTNTTAKVLQQLEFSDKIAVILEKGPDGSTDDLTQMARVFIDSLQPAQQYIKSVQGSVNTEDTAQTIDFVYSNLPLFLEESDYAELQGQFNTDSLPALLESTYKTLVSPTGMIAREFLLKDPFGLGFKALKKWQELHLGSDFQIKDGFIVTQDESKLLLFINPIYSGSETEQNTAFVEFLYALKSELNAQQPAVVSVDYFGASLVAVANAKQIKTDIQTTVLISLAALMLILIVFFKRLYIPLIIFIPSVFGALFALAFLYWYKQSLSAISLSIGAVLLGITVDYSLHILTHYKHALEVKTLYKEITQPLLMSCATTAMAFLCLLFVHSDALQDLGIFAFITVLVSGVFSLILIPQLYQPKAATAEAKPNFLDKLAGFAFDRNQYLLATCLMVVVLSLFTFQRVGFNDDLSALNYFPESLKAAEAKLESGDNSDTKSLYIAAYGTDVDSVIQNNSLLYTKLKELQKQGLSVRFSSLGGIVLTQSDQREKIARWKRFWIENNRDLLKSNLIQAGAEFGFKPNAFQGFYQLIQSDFQPIQLEEYRQSNSRLFSEFIAEKDGFYTVATVVKLPSAQRGELVDQISSEQQWLVVDRKKMNETFLGELISDFNALIQFSFLAVVCILWYFFRRIELVLVSLIPIGLTGLATAGLMGLFQLEFNIFSTIVCTLVFGHGVDFSIFMTSALQKEYSTGKNEMATYRTSILLAVITTVLAIGALIFARHPALKSIALVSLIGVFSAVIFTFVCYPLLFRFFFTNRPKKGKSPISLRLLLRSIFSFVYYGVVGVLASVVIRLIMWIAPVDKVKKYKIFSRGMSWFMKSVLYLNPLVKKGLINRYGEDFKKPAIIIANHTSFLDTLAIGMIHPNIVFLINDWVYHSPIFGKAVRMAGFYPVSQGIENSLDQLKERVDQGFSLMIFPEGTRSTDNDVKRFHKGAFYLAEKLQLDVLPFFIHGNSEVIPKGDHIIYNGQIIDVVDRRIAIDDPLFGSGYAERTKKISRYFRARFAEIRTELEGENYFRHKLTLSFLYKENEITKAVARDFESRKTAYFLWNQHLDKDESILHIADNYGQIDQLLVLQQAQRQIQTWMADPDKRAVAQTSYLVKIRKLTYLESLSSQCENPRTLLISTPYQWEELPVSIAKVLSFKILDLQFYLERGFELTYVDAHIQVLKRKIDEK